MESKKKFAGLPFAVFVPLVVQAQTPPDVAAAAARANAEQQQQVQQQRDAQQRAATVAAPGVRSAAPLAGEWPVLPVESPCFHINSFSVEVPDTLPEVERVKGASGGEPPTTGTQGVLVNGAGQGSAMPGTGYVPSNTTLNSNGDNTQASTGSDSDASLPMGSKANQFNQPQNPSYQPTRNTAANVDGTDYSGHALDRMQDRGLTPSVIQSTIDNGVPTPSRGNTTVYYDATNNVSVVTTSNGKVVTVKYGK